MGTESGESDIQLHEQVGNYHRRDSMMALLERYERIFKLYKGQLQVVERALEIAALMLGSDKSRGYSLEMICADFLAGAALETGNPNQISDPQHRAIIQPSSEKLAAAEST